MVTLEPLHFQPLQLITTLGPLNSPSTHSMKSPSHQRGKNSERLLNEDPDFRSKVEEIRNPGITSLLAFPPCHLMVPHTAVSQYQFALIHLHCWRLSTLLQIYDQANQTQLGYEGKTPLMKDVWRADFACSDNTHI